MAYRSGSGGPLLRLPQYDQAEAETDDPKGRPNHLLEPLLPSSCLSLRHLLVENKYDFFSLFRRCRSRITYVISHNPATLDHSQELAYYISTCPLALEPAGAPTGRDGSGTDTVENEVLNRTLESLRKAKEYNDKQHEAGQEILALEGEMKTHGRKYHSVPSPMQRLICQRYARTTAAT